MQSRAATVDDYLAELTPDRREIITAVRRVILQNLDRDFEEGMQYGMIGYYVPHRVYPAGYHCNPSQPLPYACLASQKNYVSLYLMSAYAGGAEENWLKSAWKQAGKRLNTGKCCIRFKKLDDVPLAVIGEAIHRVPAKKHIAQYESVIHLTRSTKNAAPQKKLTRKKSP
jgi:hypothetical protein